MMVIYGEMKVFSWPKAQLNDLYCERIKGDTLLWMGRFHGLLNTGLGNMYFMVAKFEGKLGYVHNPAQPLAWLSSF